MKDLHEDDSPVLDTPPVARGARRGPRRTAQRLGIGPDFEFDYKDPQTLSYFISDRGKIVPRRVSGLSARQQRSLALAIKRARGIALLPYTKGSP
jgi:small subunit ribosomal protein S18